MHTECYPISTLPKLSRLFLDYATIREPLATFYSSSPYTPVRAGASNGSAYATIADLLEAQNRGFGAGEAALENIAKLRAGSAAVVTGQQVTLFGGPLYTLLKAATAIRRAKDAGAVAIFWMATEDHDLAEADHVTLPSRHELHTLHLQHSPEDAGKPVGSLRLGEDVRSLLDQASELLGSGAILDTLQAAYTPEATYAEAFGQLLAKVFANEGLILIDAAGREFHRLGSRVLRAAIERAAELEARLLERAQVLENHGYEAQVLVSQGGSLLFLIDEETGARLPLKRKDDATWIAGKRQHTTADLLAILDTEPERLSPNALLRPVFQDSILPTAAYIGGPSEISYFAQSQVLYQEILGRTTPVLPRLSATLIEPAVAKILSQHELSLPEVVVAQPNELAQHLGARILPEEGRKKLESVGTALDAELKNLTEWMARLDAGLGKSAEVAAGKMRYQMDRLRRLASDYQLQKQSSLRKHVDTLYLNLFPDRHPQERIIGAAAFLARSGEGLVMDLVELAGAECPGHKAIFL